MIGGAVSGPVILGGAGPDHSLDRDRGGRAGSGCPGVRLVRGRLAADARARAAGRRACRPSSTALRIAHLSDFHLGMPSRGEAAVRKAADWVRERRPDLVVVTGDLLSRPRGRPRLDEVLAGARRLRGARQPRRRASRAIRCRAPAELTGLPATLLVDESTTSSLRGVRVQIAGDRAARLAGRARRPIPRRASGSCSATIPTSRG